jgi:RNA polymerase sigma-70 factor (ECF subfamily)
MHDPLSTSSRSDTPPPGRPDRDELTRGLYREHAAPLLRFVLGLTANDHHRAEDVVQETLLRAWQNAETLALAPGSLRPWLITVARRIVIDGHRRRSARPTEVSDAALEFVPAEDHMAEALSRIALEDALSALSPPHREALTETYLRGRTVHEAAEKLGVPAGTVKSRVYYGLRALRATLQSRQDSA